ncbi:PucR family transcriptional regulator [Saccharothrix coeruleofusca]|uniref:Transcriptional regulator n=1 Tax=Saccharothrix coeruleofusca TaxID=33919 RepID=A0A918AJ79_9PSEU|nr:PucR family transcriptional regulator [Saccharothrix coeruleofusca]MBP2334084.1 DNA-binding PucR family transcriptional regulator [Saccharothrix coeruleofusca]GGP43539.1 transcriptional regulator [Saccharothrix coeruleofusca]
MSLSQVLVALGDPLVEVQVAPHGLAVDVLDVVILDPDDAPDVRPGDFALVIGARGRAALPLVRAAGAAGAAAVAVKVDAPAPVLRQAAADAGVALLAVRPDVRWEHLESLVRAVVGSARLTADAGEVSGDLFGLAQTIAALTGGIVSIEDTASRVLAYSRSSDEVDELRRLSILGRQGPEPYLAMLREWGVYQRLRAGEEVVRVDERPELGIRRRIAIGIHAGSRPLGSIWVQEGATPLTEQAERALLGAARVTALHLVRQREPTAAFRENLLTALLDGRVDAASAADQIGADPAKPAAVVVFALRGGDGADRTQVELRRAEMTGLISVHAAAYRRSALVSQSGGRTYALLPDLPPGVSLLPLTREIVAAARRHMGLRVQAAIGSTVPSVDEVVLSRGEADRVLDAMGRDLDAEVATLADVRSRVLVSETLALLAEHPRVRDPRLTGLPPELARSLLAYLDAFGDVRAAAAGLHIHPNTLRYRVRRAAALGGFDLDDPLMRLFAQLQLRLS